MSSNNYCFTLNNYEEDDVTNLKALVPDTLRYIGFSREIAPTTGTPHLQGFLVHKDKVRPTAIKKLIPKAHIEIMRGLLRQNAKYCSKSSELEYVGELPSDGGTSEKKRWSNVVSLAKSGKIDQILEDYPDIGLRMYGTLKRIKRDYEQAPPDLDSIEAYWYTGPTGTGKSRAARANFPGIYNKSFDTWWGGYDGSSPVLFDDLSPRDHNMCDFLKRLVDHYSIKVQSKGEQFQIRPRVVVVTSNYTLEQCFPNVIDLEPLKRRFKIVNFKNQ